jgi:ComF family protein
MQVCRVLIEYLFPAHADDTWLDVVPVTVLARLARPPVVRSGISIIAPLPYEQVLVRNAIHAVKYRGHVRAARLLGEVLAPVLAEELGEQYMRGVFEDPLVVPIPLHALREKERGYNQSTRIAQALLQCLPDTPLVLRTNILTRTKHTQSQVRASSRAQRKANMAHVFSVHSRTAVSDRYVILIDDVVTTGATLHAARAALLRAGARDVLCVAVAH